MSLKTFFTMKTESGREVVFMTDKLVSFVFDGKDTIIHTVEGEYCFKGDQRRSIGLAIGKLYPIKGNGKEGETK